MARPLIAMLLALLVLLGTPPAVEAERAQPFGGRPGEAAKLPQPRLLPRRYAPKLPSYYFDSLGGVSAPRRMIGSNDVANSLRARGFRDVGPIRQRGSTYITEATGPRGERVRLVINGETGGIDGVRVIRRER